MRYRQLVLPWAFLGGVVVTLAALAVERLGVLQDERITLWPTYQVFHLNIFHGSTPGLVLFVLIVQGLIWTMIFAIVGFFARWLVSTSRRQGAA